MSRDSLSHVPSRFLQNRRNHRLIIDRNAEFAGRWAGSGLRSHPTFYFRSDLRRHSAGLGPFGNTYYRAREEKKLCRLQIWSFQPERLPELSLADEGLLKTRVKLNNDSSCSIAADFSRIACFEQYAETRNRLKLNVLSLKPSSLGDTLWSKDFNSDALCVSISPLNNYVAIGMKVRRFSIRGDSPLIEFYKLDEDGQNERIGSMKPRNSANGYPRMQQFVVNAISFIPGAGQGLMYGTSTGELNAVVPDGNGCSPDNNAAALGRTHTRDRPSSIPRPRADIRETLHQTLDTLRQRQEEIERLNVASSRHLPGSSRRQRQAQSGQNIDHLMSLREERAGMQRALQRRSNQRAIAASRNSARRLREGHVSSPPRSRTSTVQDSSDPNSTGSSRTQARLSPAFPNLLSHIGQEQSGWQDRYSDNNPSPISRSTYEDLTSWTRQAEDNRQQLLRQEERINRFSQIISSQRSSVNIDGDRVFQELPQNIAEIATALRDTREMVESFTGHLARLHAAMEEHRQPPSDSTDEPP